MKKADIEKIIDNLVGGSVEMTEEEIREDCQKISKFTEFEMRYFHAKLTEKIEIKYLAAIEESDKELIACGFPEEYLRGDTSGISVETKRKYARQYRGRQ